MMHHLSPSLALLAMAQSPYTSPVKVGARVIRGLDWVWADQDGGEGHVGTVVEIGSTSRTTQTHLNNTVVSGQRVWMDARE